MSVNGLTRFLSRKTTAKEEQELASGVDLDIKLSNRGRKPIEHHLPAWLKDIAEIVAPHSQTDPTFRSSRIYTPLTAAEVCRRLFKEKGYNKSELPCERTIRKEDLQKWSNAYKGSDG